PTEVGTLFMRRLISLLRRQDGISLIMAIGIPGVLSLTGSTLAYYSNTNARSAQYSKGTGNAYDLAEAGINENTETRPGTPTARIPSTPTTTTSTPSSRAARSASARHRRSWPRRPSTGTPGTRTRSLV